MPSFYVNQTEQQPISTTVQFLHGS